MSDRRSMRQRPVDFGLTLVAIFAFLIGTASCYVSLADASQYGAVLTTGFALWLLGTACVAGLWWRGRIGQVAALLLWGGPTFLIWAELLRRGPGLVLGLVG